MRRAIRSLWKTKTFSLVAIVTLAIGIGATTAVFSIVDAVLLKPLPFAAADRVMTLAGTNVKRAINGAPFSHPEFLELTSRDQLFSGLAAFTSDRFNVTGVDRPEQLPGARVSAGFFAVLGVDPAVGRHFTKAEDTPGGSAAAIIGRRYWMQQFNGAPSAVGTTLTLNGSPYTIVGALGIDLPPPFDDVDVWTTRVDEMSSLTRQQVRGGLGYLSAVGRLKPGVSIAQAQAEVDAIARAYARANPTNTDADPDASLHLTPIHDRTVGDSTPALMVMVAAVGLVLLIACANVATLLLVRGTARAHETAVRLALGASRADLLRWLCGESLAIALAGGVGGVFIASWGVAVASAALSGLPRGSQIAVDGRVLIFSLGVSMATGLLVGLAPALRAMRQPAGDALKLAGRGSVGHQRAGGRLLVVGEVALSLMLLVGAGLLIQSFARLLRVELGFEPRGLVTMRISLPTSKYSDPAAMRSFLARVMTTIDGTPGVASAAAAMALPPTLTVMAPYLSADQPVVGIGERPVGQWSGVTPTYFSTMGISVVAGRTFTERDDEQAPLVCVISRGLAKRQWPNGDAIGKKLLVGKAAGFAEVVGIVSDVKNNGVSSEPMVAMYTPYAQRPWPAMQLVVRAAGGDPLSLVGAVRAAVAEADRDQPISQVETMEAALSDSIASARLTTALLASFALVALVMAAAGLYGVVAYSVEQRTREIGVRVALGANPRAVLRLIAAEGVRLTAGGIAAGTAAAVLVSRAMSGLLFGVSAVDPFTYLAVVILFAIVAGVACFVPARRALRVDPLTALRAD
jgi:putative ABC transport system permease protein